MVNWKIYYADGRTWSNLDGIWEDAPVHGVVCVVVRDTTGVWGRFVNSGYAPRVADKHGNEVYVKHPDNDEPYPTWDKEPFLSQFSDPDDPALLKHVKYGLQVPQMTWQAIMETAAKDADFPVRSPRRRSSDWPAPE